MVASRPIARLKPGAYVRYWLRRPRRALRTHLAALRHPLLVSGLYLRVPGLVSPFVLTLLWDSVGASRSASPNVVEVGAYRGLSSCCLSRAAAKHHRRLWTFEWFQGLPAGHSELDAWVREGACRSDESTWRANMERHGAASVCTLVVGDACDTVADCAVLAEEGFCVAFIDVDTYGVTRAVLQALGRFIRGGEVILVHDAFSPGVQRAVDEFVAEAVRPMRADGFDQEVIRIEVS